MAGDPLDDARRDHAALLERGTWLLAGTLRASAPTVSSVSEIILAPTRSNTGMMKCRPGGKVRVIVEVAEMARKMSHEEFLAWFKSQVLKVVRDRIAELLGVEALGQVAGDAVIVDLDVMLARRKKGIVAEGDPRKLRQLGVHGMLCLYIKRLSPQFRDNIYWAQK